MGRFSKGSRKNNFPVYAPGCFAVLPALGTVLLLGLICSSIGAQEAFDLDLWHRQHPLSRETPAAESRFQLGLLPEAGVVVGFPNGMAGRVQLSISLRKPDAFGIFIGGGYEFGASVSGSSFSLGWGGVRRIPATVPQLGFSGAFLRYRSWNSKDHGHHRGLSIGVESSLGALALTAEVGLSRSPRNHWIPAARLGLSYTIPWLRDL